MPPLDQPINDGHIGYHIRTGNHDVTADDWNWFMDYADEHWGPTPTVSPTTTPTATPMASPTPTPEPGVILQLFGGGIGLAFLNKRRMRKNREPSRTGQSAS
jgi:hypothetical protein